MATGDKLTIFNKETGEITFEGKEIGETHEIHEIKPERQIVLDDDNPRHYRHKKTGDIVVARQIQEIAIYQTGVVSNGDLVFCFSEVGDYLVEWGGGCITSVRYEVFENVYELAEGKEDE